MLEHTSGGSLSAALRENRRASRRSLKIALLLAGGFAAAEVVAALWTQSVVLLADVGHMVADLAGLVLALIAIRFAEREATPEKTYGFYRAEILAAFANASLLCGIALGVLVAAAKRFFDPHLVPGGTTMLFGVLGLVVNLVMLRVLQPASGKSINVKGAYLEVLGDALASLAVIVSGGITYFLDQPYADPLFALAIAGFILFRTGRLLLECAHILLEGTPSHLDPHQVDGVIRGLGGVQRVHDLHIWTLTSGIDCLSCHVVTEPGADPDAVLAAVSNALRDRFGIEHTTIQVEREDRAHLEPTHP